MSNSLENARILVIGGSSGIGLAAAIAAAAAGAPVTIAQRWSSLATRFSGMFA